MHATPSLGADTRGISGFFSAGFEMHLYAHS